MTNENETVEQVCEKYQSVMPIPTDEIIAAHNRLCKAVAAYKDNNENK